MKGPGQNRTGVRGFAGRCLTTRPRDRLRKRGLGNESLRLGSTERKSTSRGPVPLFGPSRLFTPEGAGR